MKYFIFTLLLLSGLCSSCRQEEAETDSEYMDLQFVPRIDATSITTRTPQVGGLTLGASMGLSILPRNAYEKNSPRINLDECERYSPAPQYRRIQTTNTYSYGYSYLPVDTKDAVSSLPIKRIGSALDVYAWYPYDATFQRFEAIPFKVNQQLQENTDYMISTNGVIQLDPQDAIGSENKYVLSIPVNLKHIMTQLEFNFDISYAGPDLLPYLCIKTTTNQIHTTGTYSIYDGGITPATSSDTITFIGNYISVNQGGAGGKVQGFILPPIEVQADSEEKMKISLKFNATQPVPIQKGPLEFSLKDLQVVDTDGTTRYGLIEGYKYVIHIKVDNFVKYSGIPFVKAWGETSLEIPI